METKTVTLISNDEIRKVLNGDRFEMSGYDDYTAGRNRNHGQRGSCVQHNMEILLRFAKYGLFEPFDYLYLDFYKGCPTIYYKYWQSEIRPTESYYGSADVVTGWGDNSLCSYTTTEIIQEIFKIANRADGPKRRVNE